MAQVIRIKTEEKEVDLDVSEGVITKSSIKAALLLADNAVVSLSYDVGSRRRYCRMNEAGTAFFLPENWPNMQFYVKSDKVVSRPAALMDQTVNKGPISPYYPAYPAPTADAFMKWMYFLYDQCGKATTVCIHPRFFVTFRHGTHLQFKIGDKLTVYEAGKELEEQTGIEVCVVKINTALDFVLLKSKSDVVERGPSIAQARVSEPFTLAGFGNDQGVLSYLPGTIHSIRGFYSNFDGNTPSMGPFILGTSRSSRGDSGGGVWGSRGLIGINVACTTMPLQFHNLAISKAATFSPKNIISPAFRFKEAYMEELDKERKKEKVASPPQKKPRYMVEFEGIGTGYGSFG